MLGKVKQIRYYDELIADLEYNCSRAQAHAEAAEKSNDVAMLNYWNDEVKFIKEIIQTTKKRKNDLV